MKTNTILSSLLIGLSLTAISCSNLESKNYSIKDTKAELRTEDSKELIDLGRLQEHTNNVAEERLNPLNLAGRQLIIDQDRDGITYIAYSFNEDGVPAFTAERTFPQIQDFNSTVNFIDAGNNVVEEMTAEFFCSYGSPREDFCTTVTVLTQFQLNDTQTRVLVEVFQNFHGGRFYNLIKTSDEDSGEGLIEQYLGGIVINNESL